MRKTPSRLAALFCLLVLFNWVQYGCTAAGFVIGAAVDSKQPRKEKTISGVEVATLKPRALVTVHRSGKAPLTGRFLQVARTNPANDSAPDAMILEKKGGNADQFLIPLAEIDHVYVHPRKATGKVIGTIVGMLVDTGTLLLALKSLERE